MIAPAAWRPIERGCPIKPKTCAWISGKSRKNSWRLSENSTTSANVGVYTPALMPCLFFASGVASENIAFVTLFTIVKSTPSRLEMSLINEDNWRELKFEMKATESSPHSSTILFLMRELSPKSMSMSGKPDEPCVKNRSKGRSHLIGSICVIFNRKARRDPAAEPRAGPTKV